MKVIYATTSGATRAVAHEIAAHFGTRGQLIDLATFEAPRWDDLCEDLVIAGGPTYGRGDWHHAWADRFVAVAPLLITAQRVALFGLGDTRFHGETFCGGLGKLHDAVSALGIFPCGFTPPGRHSYRSTPSLCEGMFPGLVIDYRLDRRQVQEIVAEWLAQIARPAPPSRIDRTADPCWSRSWSRTMPPGEDDHTALT